MIPFIYTNISVKYSFNTKWNFAISYDLNNNISIFHSFIHLILTSFNAMVQNPNFVNIIRTIHLPLYNYNNILKVFFKFKRQFEPKQIRRYIFK
jgi:hypothetical protein